MISYREFKYLQAQHNQLLIVHCYPVTVLDRNLRTFEKNVTGFNSKRLSEHAVILDRKSNEEFRREQNSLSPYSTLWVFLQHSLKKMYYFEDNLENVKLTFNTFNRAV